MARSNDNLKAVLEDTANAIRSKTGASAPIVPRDFADEINNIPSGGGGSGDLLLTDDLQSYTLPPEIGQGHLELKKAAFAYCQELRYLDFNNEEEVPEMCCYYASHISEVYGSKIEIIRTSAFYPGAYFNVVSFPNCEIVEDNNFASTGRISSFYMPNLEFIGSSAFMNIKFFEDLTLNKLISIGTGTFSPGLYGGQNSSITLTVPNLIYANGSNFCSSAFKQVIAPKLTYFGSSAFYYNSWITSASFPYMRGICGGSAFLRCKNISTINLAYCPMVRAQEFSDCNNLESLSGVFATEGTYAFANCSKLREVMLYSNIANNTFSGCKSLESVYVLDVSGTLSNVNAFTGTPLSDSSILGYYGSIFVPSSKVAYYKTATNWINYSDRITALPSEFDSMYIYANEFKDRNDITAIPSEKQNCIRVLARAFQNCVNLSEINLPNCEMVYQYAFQGCKLVSAVLPNCEVIEEFGLSMSLPVTSYNFDKVKVVGQRFLEFSWTSMYSSSYMASLNLPKLFYMESYGLTGGKFQTINLPELVIMRQNIFQNVSMLSGTINCPMLKFAELNAFSGCSSVSKLSFPECVEMIGSVTMNGLTELYAPKCLSLGILHAKNLESISMPKLLNLNMIEGTSKLSHVSFPELENFTSEGGGAGMGFYNCSKLSEIHLIKIPALYEACFNNCNNLSKAMFENLEAFSVNTAARGIFTNCSKLESVYLPRHIIVENWNNNDNNYPYASNHFMNTPILYSSYLGHFGSIFVPADLLSAYQQDPYWSSLSERLVGLTDAEFQDVINHWDD